METDKLSLAATNTRLHALSASELEALAAEGLAPGPLATALGRGNAGPTPSQSSPAISPGLIGVTTLGSALPRWARLELALGLELHFRDDASPQVLEFARRIRDLAVGGVG